MKIIVLSSAFILLFITAGYAAFMTNLNITTKGNIKEKIVDITQDIVTSGDGLYEDVYEKGWYVYKGTDPNNYIKFDNGEMWRIVSKEKDGTYKIIKNDLLKIQEWDITGGTYGSNNWSRPADLNAYLNGEYYNSLDSSIKSYAVSHNWGIGAVTYNNNDLTSQINDENNTTWNGEIGLISASDYLRANTNTEQCGTHKLNQENPSICKETNWLFAEDYWTISAYASDDHHVFIIHSSGGLDTYFANYQEKQVRPALYLNFDVKITGKGSINEPYKIIS